MELTLQKKTFSCYESATPLTEKRDLTGETIIPDYCPDIARIIDACGRLCVRSKEVTDGHSCISGAIDMTLLYTAEGGGVKSFSYSLAFDEIFDSPSFKDCSELCVEAQLLLPEVRALNPRKIHTRAGILFSLTPYRRSEHQSCSAVSDECEFGIRTLCDEREVCLVKSIKEKTFTFIDTIDLKENIQELLCCKAKLRLTETKVSGGKVFLKGCVLADILCCLQNGMLQRESVELPFSQIVDGIEEDGLLTAHAYAYPTGFECTEDTDGNGHSFTLKLFGNAFVVVYQTLKIPTITDLYSTTHELTAEMRGEEVCQSRETLIKEQSVREQIESGTEVSEVLGCDIFFTQNSLIAQDGKASLRSSAVIKVLCVDEGGTPFSVERRVEVSSVADIPENCTATIEDVCCGELRAAAAGGGIEVRFSAVFTLMLTCRCHTVTLCALQVQPRSEEQEKAPSLVLKPLLKGQLLWDIAKQYRTTCEDILCANEVEDESAFSVGEMLLIPKRR